MCVNEFNPTLRFFVRNTGAPTSTLSVEVVYQSLSGSVSHLRIARLTASQSCSPSIVLPMYMNLLAAASPDGLTAVAFTFKAEGLKSNSAGGWGIDSVYVDPFVGTKSKPPPTRGRHRRRPRSSLTDERMLEASRARRVTSLRGREAWARWTSATAFLAVAVAVAVVVPWGRGAPVVAYPLLLAAYAIAARIKFEVGAACRPPSSSSSRCCSSSRLPSCRSSSPEGSRSRTCRSVSARAHRSTGSRSRSGVPGMRSAPPP